MSNQLNGESTTLTMYQVDAFSQSLFRGNPAAVVYLEEWLSDEMLQSIAMENNLAETAFVKTSDNGFDLRWFTPVHEVDFCGHATLATAHILSTEYDFQTPFCFNTKRLGIFRVDIDNSGGLTLDIPRLDPQELPPSPDWVRELFGDGTIAAFRNFENYFVELPDARCVREHQPDLVRISKLNLGGLVITSKEDGTTQADFISRYFAPGAAFRKIPLRGPPTQHLCLIGPRSWVNKNC